jgi:flagellar motor switch protein FliN
MNEQLTRYSQVPLVVEAELGRRTLTVREILSLSPGSLIKLASPVGSKVTVYVGGTSLCAGDMMRRGEAAAVRISSFFDPQGRS